MFIFDPIILNEKLYHLKKDSLHVSLNLNVNSITWASEKVFGHNSWSIAFPSSFVIHFSETMPPWRIARILEARILSSSECDPDDFLFML